MTQSITAIVPAAGVGSRMAADRPKQYLTIAGKTILEHTVDRLFSHPAITKVIIAVSKGDPYFSTLPLNQDPRIVVVDGGKERADSVLSGLQAVDTSNNQSWVLVHDAARPCLAIEDLTRLLAEATQSEHGAILAAPVRDTMKRGDGAQGIAKTVDRVDLWHALTPQMFPAALLKQVLTDALAEQATITDEASAIEWAGLTPKLVAGRADNIKVTQPEDLALAEFYLSRQTTNK